jgi:hypothetical protein
MFTEIAPFFRNFPDPTGSLLRRIGNALILGLATSFSHALFVGVGALATTAGIGVVTTAVVGAMIFAGVVAPAEKFPELLRG